MKRRHLLQTLAATPLNTALAAALAQEMPVVRPRPLVFPADFGAHPLARTEWWYVTGTLATTGSAPAEPRFGFQVTFFRSRTDLGDDQPSRFAARQLVFAHAALSDLRERRQRHDQRIARAGFGVADAAEGDTAVHLRDWSLVREGPADASRYLARFDSETGGFGLALQMATTQPVLLQGDAGYSRKGPKPGQASHYYSQPQLQVGGTLRLAGEAAAAPVQGRAWLDHEWSEAFLPDDAVGWDWIGMNLDDGSALTAFRLRRRDGTAVYAGGSFRGPGAAAMPFTADAVHFAPERLWTSPLSKARYPVAWTVDTPAGRFRVDARLDAQELDSRGSTGAFYWEGLCILEREGRAVGSGYLEMTGYAGRLGV